MTAVEGFASKFAPASRLQWHREVARALARSKGEVSPDEVEGLLGTPTDDGYTVKALYTADDARPLPDPKLPGEPWFRRGSRLAAAGAAWQVSQRYFGPLASIRTALVEDDDVDQVWLTLPEDCDPADLRSVLTKIAPGTAVTLDWQSHSPRVATALLDWWGDAPAAGSGLGLDPLASLAATGRSGDVDASVELAEAALDAGIPAFAIDGTVYHEAGASFGEEIGLATAAGLSTMRWLIREGMNVDDAAGLIEFRFAVTDEQFASIAKLRAARLVWERVLEIAGATATRGQRQHAVTSYSMLSRRDPWVNLMRNTVATFAAGVGGAEVVTVLPHTAALEVPDAFARRMARNTQYLLLEESHVGVVADPIGGSWYGECRTEDIAETAWEWLQELEGSGGLRRALDSGMVLRELNRTWNVRLSRIDHRKDPVTGVSEFADGLRDSAEARGEPHVRPQGGLPVRRWAEPFERLRDRADTAVAAGQSVSVDLVTLGPLAKHSARLTFAQNFFAAGGLDTRTVQIGEDAVTSDLVCVCGTDSSYAEELAAVVESLTSGAQLLVAGKPGARQADDEEIGVAGYIYVGCDAVAVLAESLNVLGVPEEDA